MLIENLSWKECETLLSKERVILLPLGAACKQHGYHLQLRNDFILCEYLKERIMQADKEVLVLPTINYSYYPAFVEYPGSVSLSLATASQMLIEICLSIYKFGPERFYVLNTGVSTLKAIDRAAEELAGQGIKLARSDLKEALEPACSQVRSQKGGSHADEIETSMMLYIAPETTKMELATASFNTFCQGALSRQSESPCYSESGVWGDARLATKEKGKKIVECLVENILKDIHKLRSPDMRKS